MDGAPKHLPRSGLFVRKVSRFFTVCDVKTGQAIDPHLTTIRKRDAYQHLLRAEAGEMKTHSYWVELVLPAKPFEHRELVRVLAFEPTASKPTIWVDRSGKIHAIFYNHYVHCSFHESRYLTEQSEARARLAVVEKTMVRGSSEP